MDCPRKSWWLFAGVIASGRVGGCLRVIRVGRWSATGRVSGRLWAYRQAACRVCGCASDRGLVGGCARSVYTMPEVRYTDCAWYRALVEGSWAHEEWMVAHWVIESPSVFAFTSNSIDVQ